MALAMKTSVVFSNKVAAPRAARTSAVRPVAAIRDDVARFAKAAGVGAASLALALSANAATVKLGADDGALVFDPAVVTISSGDSVTWTNNRGFPHNVVFDEDEIPSGADAEALSHEDYLQAGGESVTSKFTVAGTYQYFCEPHRGAGMEGKVIVK